MSYWTNGDVDVGQTLTDNDHLYPGHINELREAVQQISYNVKNYGAIGDGTTDDTTAIQACITAVNTAGGGTVFFPAGSYNVTSSITLYSNITLKGEPRNSIIDLSSATATLTAFTVEGTMDADITLTANVDKNDYSISLVTTTLSDLDYIKIKADNIICSSNIKQGEITRIKTVDSAASLTLLSSALDAYTTANSATVNKINFKSDISVYGLDFLGPTNITLLIKAFDFDICKDVNVTNCIFRKMHYGAMSFTDSIFCGVYECGIHDAELAGYSYGVMCLSGSQDIKIIGCSTSNLRHTVTTGGYTNDYGLVRRITALGNNISQCRSAGLDAHPNAEDINYCNNTIVGSVTEDGITIQGNNAIICNNVITGHIRHGVLLQPLLGHEGGYLVNNNIIRNCGQIGISLLQSNATYGNCVWATFSNNCIENVGTSGAYGGIFAKSTNGTQLRNIVSSGNTIKGTVGHIINYDNVYSGSIVGNNLETDTASIYGIKLETSSDNIVVNSNVITFGSSTGTIGVANLGGDDDLIESNKVINASIGIYQDNSATYSLILGNNVRGCSTGITTGSGTGHVSANNIT